MADANVTIAMNVDDKQAVKQLEKVNRAIEKLENELNKNENARLPLVEQAKEARAEMVQLYEEVERLKAALAETQEKTSLTPGQQVSPDEYIQALEDQKTIAADLQVAEQALKEQEKTVQRLEAEDAKRLEKITQQKEQLQGQKAIAGELIDRVSNIKDTDKMAAGFRAVEQSIKWSAKNILKWGFGIRSTYILIRRLRAYIKEAVSAYAEEDPQTKANLDALKNSLATLKASWGSAFAPILNYVTPALQTLISWLTTAANAIAQFFAALGGKSTFKKAVANTNAVASGLGGAADNAKDLKKQLMGIDELNVMSDNSGSSGGGGGGGSGMEYIEEEINSKIADLANFAGKVGMNIKDFFVDWELTPENIFKKVMTGAFMLLGGAIGFGIAGVPGAILGATGGLLLSAGIQALIFDNDGKLSKNEVLQSLLTVMGGILGGVIGFVAFGPVGAALGLVLGITLELGIKNLKFSDGESVFEKVKHFFWDDGILAVLNEINAMLTGEDVGTEEIGKRLAEGLKEGFVNFALGPFSIVLTIKKLIDQVKETLGIHSPSTVFAEIGEQMANGLLQGLNNKWEKITNFFTTQIQNIQQKFETLKSRLSNIVEQIKSLFNFQFQLPTLKLPHIQVQWQDAGALAKFFGFTQIPHLSVSWYAKGGIVDGATLIGAGEAGKEAIVPLERNTQWIGMVAKGLADALFGDGELGEIADRIAEIPSAIDRVTDVISGFTMPPLPAMAQGYIVPPNAAGGGYGLSDELAEKLSNFLDAFGANGSQPINLTTKVMIDKRQVGEAVCSYINERNRGRGA